MVVTGAIVLFLAIASAVWFLLPASAPRHSLTSPSGNLVLLLAERCDQSGCTRTLSAEDKASGTKLDCAVPIEESRLMLFNAFPLWRDDESGVEIVYADADGVGGKFTVVFAEDCNEPA
jgi:hypothetical protein